MCGIVGACSRGHDEVIDEPLLRRMLGTIRHRGPDEFGVYLFGGRRGNVALGNARLSIIDLAGGQQPIANEDGSQWIVFNGEIFNYIELREQLISQGHRLTTRSDTEVILHLFEQYGPECVKRLNGQFAFAIWDETSEELFLARDRCGIRPLFYTHQDGHLVFASEIKAILTHPAVTARLDPVALNQIFTYWSPLSPRTAFEGIRTLPPAHWMLRKSDGQTHIERYWEPSFPTAGTEPYRDVHEAAEALREKLVEATRLRLRADVPVGAYLSGGLDSSAITALIRHYTGNRLETFSIGFADEAFDESGFQRQMADHLDTRHHRITCTHADIGRVFPDVIWHTETPIMRTSPAPLYLLSKLVRDENFKVVLTGEGADEFLAGYNIFKEAKIRRFWARQPQSDARPALLDRLYPYVGDLASGGNAYLRRFFGQGLTDVARETYSHDIRWNNTSRSRRLFSDGLREAIGSESPGLPEDFGHYSNLAKAQFLEATVFLPEYLLCSQGDRMAMAHSVEGRFPFLDHNVVEFCNLLAPRLKLSGLNEKHVLKLAMRDLLPEAVWSRPKRPYRAPIHASFFPDGKPLDWVADMLSPSELEAAGYFQPRAVQMLTKKIQRFGTIGETDDMALAGVLSTQIVHQRFVTHFDPPPAVGDNDHIKTVTRGTMSAEASPELNQQEQPSENNPWPHFIATS